jgi:uncharacterized protein
LPLYLDANLLIKLFFDEGGSSLLAEQVVSTYEGELIVSDLAILECSSAIGVMTRTPAASGKGFKVSYADAEKGLLELDEWCNTSALMVTISPRDFSEAINFVRDPKLILRGPDALHLAVAHRLSCDLCTFDQQMRTAARKLDLRLSPDTI